MTGQGYAGEEELGMFGEDWILMRAACCLSPGFAILC